MKNKWMEISRRSLVTARLISGAVLSVAALSAGLFMSGPVDAHHSYAMFDRSHEVVIKGTVKEFDFSNPHVWIYLLVPDQQGNAVEWSLECRSTAELMRQGLRSVDIKPGDKLSVVINVANDGSKYGSVIRAATASGKHFGRSPEDAQKPV